jgi:Sensors of blue-light using FAD
MALSHLAPARTPEPASQEGLYAIVYVSQAARQLSLPELQQLQAQSQQRNLQEGVTGVLLYADGAFMQYLEGPAAGLARTYERIRPHPWHYGVIDLVREPIAEREFAGWSMAFRVVGAVGPSSESEQDRLLTQRLSEPLNAHSASRVALARFWGRGRNGVADSLLNLRQQRALSLAEARRR